MRTFVVVGVGGALGTMARHAVNVVVSRLVTHAVPVATGLANLAGCLAIGVLTGLIVGGHVRMSAPVRSFVFVGILGGFTTFSTFGLDTFTLLREGQPLVALTNVAIQVGGGLLALGAGYWLAK